MMLSDPLALLAVDAIGVEMVLQPLQAHVVIGKLALEIADGELLHGRASLLNGDNLPQ